MPTPVYRPLAQVALAATTLTDVYTTPADTETVVSSVTVCNRASAARSFRVSVAVAGASNDNKQYLAYDMAVPANDTVFLQLGITLGDADVLRAYASAADLSVNVFGLELVGEGT